MFVLIAIFAWVVWMPLLMIGVYILTGNFLWVLLNPAGLVGTTYLTWKFVHEPTLKIAILVVAEVIGIIVTVFLRFHKPTEGARVTFLPVFIMFIAGGALIGCVASYFWKFPFNF